jgi:hypothetical protein
MLARGDASSNETEQAIRAGPAGYRWLRRANGAATRTSGGGSVGSGAIRMVAGRQAAEALHAAAVVCVPFDVRVEAQCLLGRVVASTRVAGGWTAVADTRRDVVQAESGRCRFALDFRRDVVPALCPARGAVALSNGSDVVGRNDELRVDSAGGGGGVSVSRNQEQKDDEEGGAHVHVKCHGLCHWGRGTTQCRR